MSEEEIRLDQTKKVFDMLALLIKNNETCSYRYLIYDMLGFDESAYVELISGLAITNKLVECETQKELLNKIKEWKKQTLFDLNRQYKTFEYWEELFEDLDKILEEIE